jgi:phospholipid-binding lipoprotein MlaA
MPMILFRQFFLGLSLLALLAMGCPAFAQPISDMPALADSSTPINKSATPAVVDSAVSDDAADSAPAVPDPLYRWNKFWFGFNDFFYARLMRPLAKGYTVIMPKPARTGLANAYNNFTFPIRFVNALLQLDFTKASREFGRFMINSTFGVGGLMDLAKGDPNLQPGNEDFGQTLGHYGMSDGFYIVWPLIGPSTLRDSIGLAGDAAANPLTWLFGSWAFSNDAPPWYWAYVIKGGDVFNRLPDTLDNYDAVTKPAIEPYTAVKDAYIQYRHNAISN